MTKQIIIQVPFKQPRFHGGRVIDALDLLGPFEQGMREAATLHGATFDGIGMSDEGRDYWVYADSQLQVDTVKLAAYQLAKKHGFEKPVITVSEAA